MTPQDVHELVRAEGLLGGGRRQKGQGDHEGGSDQGAHGAGPIVVMVSGGQDSVCLLDVAVALRGAANVRALHVNYGLRGAASDDDARHVRSLCERLGVRLRIVTVEEAERAQALSAGNLQAWARALRYREAERLAEEVESGGAGTGEAEVGEVGVGEVEAGEVEVGEVGAGEVEAGEVDEVGEIGAGEVEVIEGEGGQSEVDVSEKTLSARAHVRARARAHTHTHHHHQVHVQYKSATLIATGHTASDQVETILYRLAASPGRRALLGMAPREGRIVRPLLSLTREQTADYCRARGLSWREDASNDDMLYARARVRNQLVPALRAVHPAAERSVLRTARLLREEGEVLDALVEGELEGAGDDRGGRDSDDRGGRESGGGRDSGDGGDGDDRGGRGIAIARLGELHPALARLIVIRLAEDAAGGYVPQAGMRVDEILALGARGGMGEVHVGGNVAARVRDGVLRMVALPPRA